jgi:hypothetical protein
VTHDITVQRQCADRATPVGQANMRVLPQSMAVHAITQCMRPTNPTAAHTCDVKKDHQHRHTACECQGLVCNEVSTCYSTAAMKSQRVTAQRPHQSLPVTNTCCRPLCCTRPHSRLSATQSAVLPLPPPPQQQQHRRHSRALAGTAPPPGRNTSETNHLI